MLTHSGRNADKVTRKRGPPAVTRRSSKGVARNASVRDMRQDRNLGGGEGLAPYDTETPPVPALPPSTAGDDGRAVHKVIRSTGGGTIDQPSLKPLPGASGTSPHLPASLIRN